MRSWLITDKASGQLIRTQTWDDQFAPVTMAGQIATLVATGSTAATGTFSGVGAGASCALASTFNITLSGTFVATVQLERSFDGGTSWNVATLADGTPVLWTTAASTWWTEPEAGVLIRLNCTARTSGSVAWMLSQ